jgi:hypothetical protein
LGNETKSLVNIKNTNWNYCLELNAASLHSGIYFNRLMAADLKKNITLIK